MVIHIMWSVFLSPTVLSNVTWSKDYFGPLIEPNYQIKQNSEMVCNVLRYRADFEDSSKVI